MYRSQLSYLYIMNIYQNTWPSFMPNNNKNVMYNYSSVEMLHIWIIIMDVLNNNIATFLTNKT